MESRTRQAPTLDPEDAEGAALYRRVLQSINTPVECVIVDLLYVLGICFGPDQEGQSLNQIHAVVENGFLVMRLAPLMVLS